LSDEEMADFYGNKLKFDMRTNEYLLIKNNAGDIVDKYKYSNSKLSKVKYKSIESQILGRIKARNIKQELFMDLLDSDIPLKVVTGVIGSGKSMLSTVWALQEMQRGKFNKLVVIRNNVDVQDVPGIGALPGTETEKLKSYCMFISDIISDFMFDTMLQQNKIELCYLGSLRGRSFNDCCVLCSEAQNLTTTLVRMIVSRMGENSVLIFDGDLDQIDRNSYSKDNGLMAMANSLAGNPLFGMVELDLIERSALARLSSLIK
jgi:PhoH-like ATPase